VSADAHSVSPEPVGATEVAAEPVSAELKEAVFGAALPGLEQYAALLAGPGTERGLLGPREVPRLWERHLLNCAGLSELVVDGEVVLDLGSGAGLPGVVLALQRPQVQVVLVESLQRRAAFLSECVEHLGLRNALVRRARAEELHGKVEVDVVTARAVAPVDRLAAWALPLLRPGGRLLALKGERAEQELAAARPALARLGTVDARVQEVGDVATMTQGRIVVVEAGRVPAPQTKPRKKGRR
jgi:16S rRNA (guanine527-N7)-methyltransferase